MTSFVTKARCCKDLVGVIYAVGGQTKSGNSLSTVEVSISHVEMLIINTKPFISRFMILYKEGGRMPRPCPC